MRVVICGSDHLREVSGPSAWLRRWSGHLRDDGHEVIPFCYCTDLPEKSPNTLWLREQGFDTRALQVRNMRQSVGWTLDTIADIQPDVVVANTVVAAHYASKWLTPSGIPVVSVIHSDDRLYVRLMQAFLDEGSPHRVAGYVCVSEHLRRKAEAFGAGLPSATIACGAPMPDLRASPPEPDGEFRLIYVGRISKRQKRILDVGNAFCAACEQVPGVTATIVGAGPVEDELRTLLEKTPGGEKVNFVGRLELDQIQPAMAGSHCCVLLSDYEGIPISLMEAMGLGLVPIVSPMESGIPELVVDGGTGLYAPDRDSGFVAKVRELKETPGLWQRLSDSARNHVENRYASDECARRWERFLEDVASAHNKKPFSAPKKISFPKVGANCSWADASMATGLRAIYLRGAKWAWLTWRKVPWPVRARVKKLVGTGW